MRLAMELMLSGGSVLLASIIIGWAAETAQVYIGQGLALAILAWLQTSPEFAVEAVIAWHQRTDFMIANLTGSLRLLVGLGWPLVYFTNAFFGRKGRREKWPVIRLKWFNGLEVITLFLGTSYFFVIWWKATLTVYDAIVLIAVYIWYLTELARLPVGAREDEEDLPGLGKKIVGLKSKWSRGFSVFVLFAAGGLLLTYSIDPFLHSLEALAAFWGISTFFFIQWCAPFVSEFPEKVTAFNWARRSSKAPMALINMSSSNIVQWTLMAGLIPVIYNISKGQLAPINFDSLHREEILITVMQSFLSIGFLADLELSFSNALGLFVLWAIQFLMPSTRHLVMIMYVIWGFYEYLNLAVKGKLLYAFKEFWKGRERGSKSI